MTAPDDLYLTVDQVAEILRLSVPEVQAYDDEGPPTVKLAGRVLYERAAFVAWIKSRET